MENEHLLICSMETEHYSYEGRLDTALVLDHI